MKLHKRDLFEDAYFDMKTWRLRREEPSLEEYAGVVDVVDSTPAGSKLATPTPGRIMAMRIWGAVIDAGDDEVLEAR